MEKNKEDITVNKEHYNRLWLLIHALEGKLFYLGLEDYCNRCRRLIFERDIKPRQKNP